MFGNGYCHTMATFELRLENIRLGGESFYSTPEEAEMAVDILKKEYADIWVVDMQSGATTRVAAYGKKNSNTDGKVVRR